jgi:predicted DNA binding CopG/RHH family protein
MTEKKHQTESRIPEFTSYQEEAEFWDTHDTADFEDEFKPVRVRIAKNLSEGITIRLDPETLQKVRILAKEKGVGPTVLIRMWVMEHLKETRQSR